ncbi:Hypothetical predicted protein [Olea europaea subsp. europaea]|uniref:Uncharacterized protein n=1 Tax=Olea europaea subsp. europaea TaxID=158383 RepID=A0A8S0S5Y7_OLEEU|nr:Hypothetical predicted protein [Olea europaea subsp. europaea]
MLDKGLAPDDTTYDILASGKLKDNGLPVGGSSERIPDLTSIHSSIVLKLAKEWKLFSIWLLLSHPLIIISSITLSMYKIRVIVGLL